LHLATKPLLEQIDALGVKIGDYDRRVRELAARHPEIERLAEVPGVGTLTAATFVLTLGRK
jgi:transposase